MVPRSILNCQMTKMSSSQRWSDNISTVVLFLFRRVLLSVKNCDDQKLRRFFTKVWENQKSSAISKIEKKISTELWVIFKRRFLNDIKILARNLRGDWRLRRERIWRLYRRSMKRVTYFLFSFKYRFFETGLHFPLSVSKFLIACFFILHDNMFN